MKIRRVGAKWSLAITHLGNIHPLVVFCTCDVHNSVERSRKHFQLDETVLYRVALILHVDIHETGATLLDKQNRRHRQEGVCNVVGDDSFGRLCVVRIADHQSDRTGIGRLNDRASEIFHSEVEGTESSVGREVDDATVRRHTEDARVVLVSVVVVDGQRRETLLRRGERVVCVVHHGRMIHPVDEDGERLDGTRPVGTGENDADVGESVVSGGGHTYGSTLYWLGGGW